MTASLNRITLHEARHTYASFLMAAGYNLRHIKNRPVPWGTTEGAKLDAYLAAEVGGIET